MNPNGLDASSSAASPGDPPRSLSACLPWIWRRLLFPGAPVPAAPLKWQALLLLVVLPGALLYPCMSFYLFEPDEGRYAEIPREMLLRGEWVVPYLHGEPYLDKPPLMYWLVMLSYRALGVHDWSARLVPALAVHACVLLTYVLGRRHLGERAAFWGALALCLAPGFLSIGRLLVLDGLLALCVTLSVLSAFEAVSGTRLRWAWWLLAASACGLGVLTKGPVALLLLLPPLLTYRWLNGSDVRIGGKGWLAFAAVVLAVCLPWYVAVCVRVPQFAGYFLWEQNVVRFLAPFDHLRPIWFYVPVLLAGLLPATLLAVPFARFLFSDAQRQRSCRCPELGFMLLAGGWCVLFFSLSGCKLPTYILPAFPPLALVLGYYLASSDWHASRWIKPVTASAVLLLAVGHYGLIPWYAHFRSPMQRPEDLVRLCGDRTLPVICYPRNCDSVAFYLGRDDLLNYRSKETPDMIRFMAERSRTVVVFTHRHSLNCLREVLPAPLRLTEITPLGGSWKDGKTEYCYLAVVEHPGL